MTTTATGPRALPGDLARTVTRFLVGPAATEGLSRAFASRARRRDR